ncbi:MAG: metalloregulator ArsR/SmtB family transcription factor [Steroidobacteraceae bacterium]
MKSDADRDLVATLAALAQSTRVAILRLVSQAGADGIAAGDIARSTDTPPSTLSFHLKEMTQAGLLKARNQGRFIYYSLDDRSIVAVIAFLNSCRRAIEPPSPEPAKGNRKTAPKAKKGRSGTDAPDDGQMNIFGD